MASTDDYLGLVTSEHRDQPNFSAIIQAFTQGFVDEINNQLALPSQLNLDTAQGDQLDILGKWVGFPRTVAFPVTGVYFALDTPAVGFDQGSWKGPNDPDTGIVTLDDGTYRLAIKAKIGANFWDGTMPSFLVIMNLVFAGTGITVTAVDNQNMTMDVTLSAKPPALLRALIVSGFLPLKPAGVQQNFIIPS